MAMTAPDPVRAGIADPARCWVWRYVRSDPGPSWRPYVVSIATGSRSAATGGEPHGVCSPTGPVTAGREETRASKGAQPRVPHTRHKEVAVDGKREQCRGHSY